MSVNVPLGPLLDPAFHLGSVPTTWAELLGFATGAVNVWLVVRQNILNWPIGIANVILLGLVFLDGGLYADAGGTPASGAARPLGGGTSAWGASRGLPVGRSG